MNKKAPFWQNKMKQAARLILSYAVMILAMGCTGSGQTTDNDEAQAAWRQAYGTQLQDTQEAQEWLKRCAGELARHEQAGGDSAQVLQKLNHVIEKAVNYQTREKDLQLKDLRITVLWHRLVALALAVTLLLIGYFLWRSYKYNKVLAAKNRRLYELTESQKDARKTQQPLSHPLPVTDGKTYSQGGGAAEEETDVVQTEMPADNGQAEEPSKNGQAIEPTAALPHRGEKGVGLLYNRLCELMKNPDVYTNPSTNHETLARLLGTNHTYLYAALRECAGQTPADFLNLYRIRHAALLLSKTDEPVGLIIEQSGITNRSTFNRLFREHYSMSPSEYRRAAKEQ